MYKYKLLFRELFYFLKSFFNSKKNNYYKNFFNDGYIIVSEFLNIVEVNELKESLERELTNKKNKIIIDDKQSDIRIYGVDKINKKFENIINNKVDTFFKKNFGFTFENSFLMANKLIYKKNNLGSGQGWHRDSEPIDQYKCLIYLDDVSSNNGPFQYIKKTHSPLSFLKLFFYKKIRYYQYRFNQKEIDNIISSDLKCITFNEKKGSAIFFNSRGIHRGMPISKGIRYACTSYYFDKNIPQHLKEVLNE